MQTLKLTKIHIVFILWLLAVILRFLFYYEIENALWLMSFFLDFILLFVGITYAAAVIYYPIIIDGGPPIRIAFSWGGIIDNWYGIVYDPTAEVLRARMFKSDWSNWNDSKLLAVKKLFGGNMKFAKQLWGDWYFCSFT